MQTVYAAALLCLTFAPPVAAAPEAMAGAVEHFIDVDGLARGYYVFVPQGPQRALPVLIALHGGGGNGRQMERYTRFDALAQREGFIVIYPNAVDGNWNDGRGVKFMRAQRDNIDDVKFIRAILGEVAKTTRIDYSRVFACGISNGAFMSHRLAADASDLICGIAPVVGGMAPAVYENFHPRFPVSILIIQGDADPIVPIHGGEVRMGAGRGRGRLVDTDKTLAKYLQRNGNPDKPSTSAIDSQASDGTSVEVVTYPDAPNGTKTAYYRVRQGGHAWPGRRLYMPESTIGKACQEFDASQTIWNFFESCPPRRLTRPSPG